MNLIPLCSRVSDEGRMCACGSTNIIKNGFTKTHKQQYYCKSCCQRFIAFYSYKACQKSTNDSIIQLLKEGVGIRSTARLLKISTTTVIKRILRIAKDLELPFIIKGGTYEVDEIKTFVKRKKRKIWIVYALERASRQVVSFNIGARTNKTLNVVLTTLTLSKARRIYTDKLVNYRYLIDYRVHRTNVYGTNHIERKNLTLRTHLKRLNRRTICFSRSIEMLRACLLIYFFRPRRVSRRGLCASLAIPT